MAQYLVGIDLGTTHTVVAYARADAWPADAVQVLKIPQLVAAGEVSERPLLPSVCYLYQPGELDAADIGLPWPSAQDTRTGQGIVVGEWARELGEKTPGRLVTSAKSWLSHNRVDRGAAILPWGNADASLRISPLRASACFLAHVRAAWNHQFPRAPLEHQSLVITVPASFDEGARALTLAAAEQAGLGPVRLLEEPQAACYDWLASHAKLPASSRLLLICDIGGGTTDLTLIGIDQSGREPVLERIGVGDHLMLGGDNIDLALAHQVEQQSGEQRLNYARLSQLLQQTRLAKEALLRPDAPEGRKVTLLAGGRQLLAGSRSVEIGRLQVQQLVLQGYFPLVELQPLARARRSAMVEFGLPYESEAAVTRHLADFILRHQQAMAQALGQQPDPARPIVPDSLLLNGGVFNAALIRQRVVDQLQAWRGETVAELTGTDPNQAVARGAVYYELARVGKGRKIGGGSARSYYLKLAAANGGDGEADALICLLPKGSPVGIPLPLPDREFALMLHDPVRFELLASTSSSAGVAGQLLVVAPAEQMTVLPPMTTVLTRAEAANDAAPAHARVRLQTELTEVGTLALSCVDSQTGQQWRLDFDLRNSPAVAPDGDNLPVPGGKTAGAAPGRHPRLDDALGLIDKLFGKAAKKPDPKLVKTIRIDLEKLLGARLGWDTPLIRALFDRLLAGQKQRRRSSAHERTWLNLTGFCLRPGYGAELDEWRVAQVGKIYQQGVIHKDEPGIWAEWWTLWRRIAGALGEPLQDRLFADIRYYLHPDVAHSRKRMAELQKRGYGEMVRLLGSLEGLEVEQKKAAGDWLLRRLQRAAEPEQTWWAIGRLGARVPFHGNAHRTVDAATAEDWLERLLQTNWQKQKTSAFAATLIARHSGDRELDIGPAIQQRVIARLEASRCAPAWLHMVRQRAELEQADIQRAYGEAMPQGLRLL